MRGAGGAAVFVFRDVRTCARHSSTGPRALYIKLHPPLELFCEASAA